MTLVSTVGTKEQVYKGLSAHTPGYVYKSGIVKRKGRYRFKAKSAAAKKGKGFKALKKGGFVVKKGQKPFFLR